MFFLCEFYPFLEKSNDRCTPDDVRLRSDDFPRHSARVSKSLLTKEPHQFKIGSRVVWGVRLSDKIILQRVSETGRTEGEREQFHRRTVLGKFVDYPRRLTNSGCTASKGTERVEMVNDQSPGRLLANFRTRAIAVSFESQRLGICSTYSSSIERKGVTGKLYSGECRTQGGPISWPPASPVAPPVCADRNPCETGRSHKGTFFN
ncbi:uncharacterized protein LOC105694508 [Orussus abietinus]|uniref:uncharacterized protein LOC105694508 n=1 Tax=Orussus abietinus TaxID=222816 RepID=UPI000625A871|nr:uncharacterized protein LOC105694508 [Orussus abietinus]